MEKQKNILVFIQTMTPRYVEEIRAYEKEVGKQYRLMLLRDSRVKRPVELPDYDLLVECDFSKPDRIAEALLTHQEELLAITCRTEQNIARFAQVIPHVPYLRTPTPESLEWAADKYKMRRRLQIHDPKNTPRFTKVKDTTKKERTRVIEKVSFPMIIKPANMAGSLFVSVCYHEEELEKTLKTLFRKIRKAYEADTRKEVPTILAEEYMEGLQFSLDSYVNSRGTVFHCPLVRQKTAKEIGHDDFYTYLQMTPSALKKTSIEKAEAVATTAIHALGLRSVTTHVELLKVDDEWKVIEVGARPGGFRDILHSLSCDIKHTVNDLVVRIPQKPVIPKKCKGYAAAIKWFDAKEGVITSIRGIKKVEELDSFEHIEMLKKVGDRSIFARNGGRAIFKLFLYNKDRSKLLADIRRVEQEVDIKVETRSKKVAVKKTTKKTVKKTKKK